MAIEHQTGREAGLPRQTVPLPRRQTGREMGLLRRTGHPRLYQTGLQTFHPLQTELVPWTEEVVPWAEEVIPWVEVAGVVVEDDEKFQLKQSLHRLICPGFFSALH